MCIYTIEYCTAMKNKMNYYHIHIRTQMNFRNNAEQIILFNFQNWGKQIYGWFIRGQNRGYLLG